MEKNYERLPEAVREGISLFKLGQYYQAHESFETAWRNTEAPAREFYRALIQISGGFYRLSQNRPKAAKKFFNHALKWLAHFPDSHHGFNTALLKDDLNKIIQVINQGQVDLDKIKKLLHPLDPQEK